LTRVPPAVLARLRAQRHVRVAAQPRLGLHQLVRRGVQALPGL